MGNTESAPIDNVPLLSQTKSLVQACCGDSEGATRTQENFSRGCPIVSQARSAAEAALGRPESALQTQLHFLGLSDNQVDDKNQTIPINHIPIVSQVKSLIQSVSGDLEGACETQEEFSRGCAIISQLRSAGEAILGDSDAALKTQQYFYGVREEKKKNETERRNHDSSLTLDNHVQDNNNVVENQSDAEIVIYQGFEGKYKSESSFVRTSNGVSKMVSGSVTDLDDTHAETKENDMKHINKLMNDIESIGIVSGCVSSLDVHESFLDANSISKDDSLCVICMENKRRIVCLPCKHLCLCSGCSESLRSNEYGCPLCRKSVDEFMSVYI